MDLTLWQAFLLELGLGTIGVVAGWAVPALPLLARIEKAFARLAANPALSFFSLVLASIALRLLLLPIEPVPGPLYHDEFSYLLGADTFVHGRLTNPTPAIPIAFESIHVNMSPTYQSMYLPGVALALAAGRLLGSAWIAVLLITALFCGTVYWMTAAWLPRAYALLAGIIAIAITGNLNWWFDNYFCIALTSLGTALLLGSLPRIAATLHARWALLGGVGLSVLMLTRPYEGLCVTLPCVLTLLWQLRRKGPRTLSLLIVAACSPLLLAGAWLLFYNWRSTGHALLFPYMVDFARYHITGPFLFSAKRALPPYDLDILRRFYIFAEVSQYDFVHKHPWLFLAKKIAVYYVAVLIGFGLPFVAGLVYLIRTRRNGLWMAVLLGFCGLVVNVVLMAWSPFPQYIAPAFPLLLLVTALGFFQMQQMSLRRVTGSRIRLAGEKSSAHARYDACRKVVRCIFTPRARLASGASSNVGRGAQATQTVLP